MTKKDLSHSLGIDISMIEQVDAKQLFIVRCRHHKELYSYFTKVGETSLTGWILTTRKYSCTTSKQLSQFANAVRRNGYDVKYSEEI